MRSSIHPWMICNVILAQFGYVPAAADPDPQARLLDAVRRTRAWVSTTGRASGCGHCTG